MKKETIYAISLGVFLGFLIAFIMILILRPSGQKKTMTSQSKTTIVPKKIKKNFQSLEISSPSDRQIMLSKKVTIRGSVEPGSLIIITSSASEKTIKNKEKNFQIDFPLVLGENVISIQAFVDKTQRTPQIKTLQVFYLEEE
jgi:hypothetical protein